MSRVLFLYERDMPTVSITRETMKVLNQQYALEFQLMRVQDVSEKDLNDADVLYFIRPNDSLSTAIASQGKKSGRLIVTMFDDDLLNLPPNVPLSPWRKNSIELMLGQTDVIVSSSRYLVSKYKQRYGIKRGSEINTIVRTEEFCEFGKTKDWPVKIVYAAGPKHIELFNRFVLPIIPKLCDKYGKKISLTFVGLYPKLDEFREKLTVNVVGGMPLLEYRKYMQEQRFDVGLAPLVTNDFTKCKYFNKYLEYTTANIVGVYSKAEPYTYVIKDGWNGFLAEDSPEAWFRTICLVIENAELRKKCVENAVRHVKENHSVEGIGKKMFEDIPELLYGVKEKKLIQRVSANRLKYKILRMMDYLYLTWFYLKNAGISGFLYQLKVHLREYRNY